MNLTFSAAVPFTYSRTLSSAKVWVESPASGLVFAKELLMPAPTVTDGVCAEAADAASSRHDAASAVVRVRAGAKGWFRTQSSHTGRLSMVRPFEDAVDGSPPGHSLA